MTGLLVFRAASDQRALGSPAAVRLIGMSHAHDAADGRNGSRLELEVSADLAARAREIATARASNQFVTVVARLQGPTEFAYLTRAPGQLAWWCLGEESVPSAMGYRPEQGTCPAPRRWGQRRLNRRTPAVSGPVRERPMVVPWYLDTACGSCTPRG